MMDEVQTTIVLEFNKVHDINVLYRFLEKRAANANEWTKVDYVGKTDHVTDYDIVHSFIEYFEFNSDASHYRWAVPNRLFESSPLSKMTIEYIYMERAMLSALEIHSDY
jgi:hypothetical protein